jgi:D-aminoacyl-tRNA deacylase
LEDERLGDGRGKPGLLATLAPALRLVVQRVTSGSVTWQEAEERHTATIGLGLVLLVGAEPDDDEATIRKLADKVIDLRIFADDAGRMNLSLVDVKGSALIVSQFTLFADMSRGRRPSLLGAGDPKRAEEVYHAFVRRFPERGIETKTGSFGADMKVGIENDGPVTLVLSSDDWPTRV